MSSPRRPFSPLSSIAVLLMAPALSGCFPNIAAPENSPQPSLIQVHQETKDTAVNTSAGEAEIRAALAPVIDGFNDPSAIYVTVGTDGSAATPAAVRRITAVLTSEGVKPARITVVASAKTPRNFIDVTVSHVVAIPPKCASLVKPSQNDFLEEHTNFAIGCANLSNLAQMLDDPRELTQPAPYPGTLGEPQVNAVHRYNEDKTTPLQRSSSQATSAQ